MSEHPTWSVGNRLPPITENIVDENGNAVDLTGASGVTFSMRRVGSLSSATPKVNAAAATIVGSPTLGNVRYSWASGDVDTAGEYLCWWTVTAGGLTQDVMEALVVFEAHGVGTNAYLEVEELKSTLELDNGNANLDLDAAILAASRAVDDITQTRFFTTASDEVRYYTPDAAHVLFTDEINTLTELATGNGTTFAAWTANTDFVLEPLNATLDTRPWHTVRTLNSRSFTGRPRSVRVTGKFGWTAPPEAVRVATGIIATKIVKRAKDAPMGVLTFFDGTAMRISRFDPQVEELLAPYNRSTPFS